MDDERFVCRAAMEIDGGAEHRDLNQDASHAEGEEKMQKQRYDPPGTT
jgi:hypothetical protein